MSIASFRTYFIFWEGQDIFSFPKPSRPALKAHPAYHSVGKGVISLG